MSYDHSEDETKRLSEQSEVILPAESALLRRLAPVPPRRILDVGCGPGSSAPILRAAFPGAALYGIEESAEAVDSARASGYYAEVVQGRVPSDAPTGRPFDLVFSRLMLRHTADSALAVAWMWDAAAVGGRVVLADSDDATLLFHPEQAAIADALRGASSALVSRYGNPFAATSGRTLSALLAACGAADPADAAITLTTSGNLITLPGLARKVLQAGCQGDEARLDEALARWRASPGAFASWTLFYAAGTRH